jgi:hypothetical protein
MEHEGAYVRAVRPIQWSAIVIEMKEVGPENTLTSPSNIL